MLFNQPFFVFTSAFICLWNFTVFALHQKLWPQAPSDRMWPHFGCFLSSPCFNQELGSFSKREMSNRIWVWGKKWYEDTFTGWSLLVRAPAALCDSVSCPLCAIAPPPLIVHLQDLLPMIVHLCIVQEPPPHECSLVHSAKWKVINCNLYCALSLSLYYVPCALWARSPYHDFPLAFSCPSQPGFKTRRGHKGSFRVINKILL